MKRIATLAAVLINAILLALVMAGSSPAAASPTYGDISRPSAHPFNAELTGRVTVDRCIRALQAWGRSDDDVQLADRATVVCSAIVKDKDAAELTRWINGTGRYSAHRWAWAIVG